MTVFKWSLTADDNDDADSTINYREGQGPRTLNNSARAMMTALKKWWSDLSGNVVTGGTSTAITIATNQGYTALTDGIHVKARITTTNGTDATLAVDGLTAKQIRTVYGSNIPLGALLAGSIHEFTYDATDDAWIVAGRFGDTLTSGANPDLVAIEALSGTTGVARKTAANTWALEDGTTNIVQQFGDGINVISAATLLYQQIPFACTITGVFLLADQSGAIVIDIWKDSYANYPPTDADSITASAPPTISATNKATDTTLTDWATSISAGDILGFNVDSCSSIKRCTLVLRVKRFI